MKIYLAMYFNVLCTICYAPRYVFAASFVQSEDRLLYYGRFAVDLQCISWYLCSMQRANDSRRFKLEAYLPIDIVLLP